MDNNMEKRLSAVETEISGLKSTVSSISSDVKALASSFNTFATKAEATRPPSWRENIALATQIGILISMIVGGIFFLVEYKVGNGTARANAFVESMEKEGRIYVTLHDQEQRLKHIERQLSWKAELVPSTTR